MIKLLISCEHASNKVPAPYQYLFERNPRVLKTHRAYDIGIHSLAQKLARYFQVKLHAGNMTRLLIDLNRELDSKTLFSEYSLKLSDKERKDLIRRHHQPHFKTAEKYIEKQNAKGHQVLHLGVHSFTPLFKGEQRETEIGLLFDPVRASESEFVDKWIQKWRSLNQKDRIRKNYPYHGRASGLVSHLRKLYSDAQYMGIELEVNQKFYRPGRSKQTQTRLENQILVSFEASLFQARTL